MKDKKKLNEAQRQRPGDGWEDQRNTSTREDEVSGLVGNKKVLFHKEKHQYFKGKGEGWSGLHGRVAI